MVSHCAVISLWVLISHGAVISQSAMMARLQCQAQTSLIDLMIETFWTLTQNIWSSLFPHFSQFHNISLFQMNPILNLLEEVINY